MQTHSVRPPFSRVTLVIPPVFVSAANSQIKTTPWQLLRRRRRRRRRRYFLHRAIGEFMRLLLCCCCCCTGAHPPSARAGWQTDTKKKLEDLLLSTFASEEASARRLNRAQHLSMVGFPVCCCRCCPGLTESPCTALSSGFEQGEGRCRLVCRLAVGSTLQPCLLARTSAAPEPEYILKRSSRQELGSVTKTQAGRSSSRDNRSCGF